MAMLCALDWRHGLVTSTVTRDPDGACRLTLGHGPDEVVLHASQDTLDALACAIILCPRPPQGKPWDLTLLT